MVINLAESRGHLVGESASDDHAIGLAWAGPEDDTETVQIVASSTGVHHFDGAASKSESHGPDGPSPGPVHEVVDFRDHELRRLREARGRWAPGIGGRSSGGTAGGCGGGREEAL